MNNPSSSPAPTKLYKKLVEILQEVGTVKKSGHNSHQQYDYTTEKDILDAIRPELAKRSVFLFTSVESVERDKESNVTTVITNHTFWDAETDEHFTVQSAGQGYDKQDKGIFKAITGANKYFFMKNFLISSEDDPENDAANKPKTPAAPASNPSLSKFKSAAPASTPKAETKPEQAPTPVAAPTLNTAPSVAEKPKQMSSFAQRFGNKV